MENSDELLADMLMKVKKNVQELKSEWYWIQEGHKVSSTVIVPKTHLETIHKQIAEIRHLTCTCSPNVGRMIHRCQRLEEELKASQTDNENMNAELSHWKVLTDIAKNDWTREKEEKFKFLCQVQELTHQLHAQSEYCAKMGTETCTLLWRISQSESTVQAMLSGNTINSFMELVRDTFQSFLVTYCSKEESEPAAEETYFILSLCGIITNIAAAAIGRDYLVRTEMGLAVIQHLITFLSKSDLCTTPQLKSLCLMTLYNLSISKKGHSYLSGYPGMLHTLGSLIQKEKDIEVRVMCLKLSHSLSCDQANKRLHQELQRAIPLCRLQELAADSNKQISEVALELATVMGAFQE